MQAKAKVFSQIGENPYNPTIREASGHEKAASAGGLVGVVWGRLWALHFHRKTLALATFAKASYTFAKARVNMNLQNHIDEDRGNATKLAASLGIPLSYLSQMATGARTVSPEKAVSIEQLTEGKVMRWDLRPKDWHLIWPELKGVAGAPVIAEEVA